MFDVVWNGTRVGAFSRRRGQGDKAVVPWSRHWGAANPAASGLVRFLTGTQLKDLQMKTLADAFHHTLQDIYYAETALTKALPKVASAASNAEFKSLVQAHLSETKQQVTLLDKVFASIGEKAKGEKCDAIEGLIKETEGIMKDATGVALDASLIAAAQAVEHYEIARYGTLREWAKVLGHTEAHDLLSQILDQEKAANSKLTALAVASINTAKRVA
jgi:ferritin-like metal-binding protein YciE